MLAELIAMDRQLANDTEDELVIGDKRENQKVQTDETESSICVKDKELGDGSETERKSYVDEDRNQELSHTDAMHIVKTALADVITKDPLLYDLPAEATLEEVNSSIALEYGQAMVVNVRRADDEVMAVVVKQDASVLDLRHAIQRHFILKQTRNGGKKHISWRYIWRRYWIYFDGQKLSELKKPLKEYGIRNKTEVTFMKRLKER